MVLLIFEREKEWVSSVTPSICTTLLFQCDLLFPSCIRLFNRMLGGGSPELLQMKGSNILSEELSLMNLKALLSIPTGIKYNTRYFIHIHIFSLYVKKTGTIWIRFISFPFWRDTLFLGEILKIISVCSIIVLIGLKCSRCMEGYRMQHQSLRQSYNCSYNWTLFDHQRKKKRYKALL